MPAQTTLKVIAIGNSRGIRLPKAVLERYAVGEELTLEMREDGMFLRNKADSRQSWADTYRAMAAEAEDWSDLDAAVGDGVAASEPW